MAMKLRFGECWRRAKLHCRPSPHWKRLPVEGHAKAAPIQWHNTGSLGGWCWADFNPSTEAQRVSLLRSGTPKWYLRG